MPCYRDAALRSASALIVSSILFAAIGCGDGVDALANNHNTFSQTNFVAGGTSGASYRPTVANESTFIDAWGLAIRPAGIPGHFWVVAGDTSYEYVGDVNGRPLVGELSPLPTNRVKIPGMCASAPYAALPCPASDPTDIANNHTTGVVFNASATSFVITETPTTGAPITSGAKFLFATSTGVISAWTERKKSDGTYDRAEAATAVIDESNNGGAFYGLSISPSSDRLYVADFGTALKVRVYDDTFKEITDPAAFKNPFVSSQDAIKAGDYVPWNVHVLGNSVFVMYAQAQEDPKHKGKPYPGNEVHAPGAGRLVEFDLSGKQIAIWNDGGQLNAPWGMAQAPSDFGPFSGMLLVGNFGDYDGDTSNGFNKGSIVVFDPKTRKPVDHLRDTDGNLLLVPGVWGLTFGNGDTLGDANALYFAAGPAGEADGLFGSIRYTPQP